MPFIIGGLDDQLTSLVWGRISSNAFAFNNGSFNEFYLYREVFWPMLKPWETNEPVLWFVLSFAFSIFGLSFYNFFLAATLLSAFFGSFFLLRKYKFGLILSLLFTFSAYMWIHLGIHPALSQIWVVPVFIKRVERTFVRGFSYKDSITNGLFLSLTTLISNYLGFFSLVTLVSITLVNSLLPRRFKIAKSGSLIATSTITFLTFLSVSMVVLFPYLRANYLRSPGISDHQTRMFVINRSLSDFFTFSIRPWYFLVPPSDSLLYGELSSKILGFIKSSNNFLTDDYFEREHVAGFYGLSFWTVFLIVFLLMLKRKNLPKLFVFWLVNGIILFLLSLPPFFSLGTIKVFTPGFLVFSFFPMFRVTSRSSIFIFLFLSLSLGELLKAVSLGKRLRVLFGVLLLFSLIEVFVPFKILRYGSAPDVFTYLGGKEPKTVFAVYPYSKTKEALFWLPTHQQFLLNPRGATLRDFHSETFTKALITDSGQKKLRELDADYLVLFKKVKDKELQSILGSPNFLIEAEFDDSYLLRVNI